MKIKVCGLRDMDNLRAVDGLGIDYIGFIRYQGSIRFVPDEQMQRISKGRFKARKVGVYVNESLQNILSDAERYDLAVIQLHGDEDLAFAKAILEKGYQVFKAFGISDKSSLAKAIEFATLSKEYGDDFTFLLDTKTSQHGGSGKKWDWNLLDGMEYPFILSGGIDPEDVSAVQALRHPQLVGVDLNSRFEREPAVKDPESLSAFISKMKQL